MNRLEKVIAWAAPGWAARRQYYRSALDLSRAYDAAKIGRRTESWVATGNSANAELLGGLDRIRYRSRDLVRNNPYGARAVRSLASHMVGRGIIPRPLGLSEAAAKKVNKNWKKFVKHSDACTGTNFYAQMHLAARCIVEAGEVLLVWRDLPNGPCPLSVDVLEPDYIDTAKTERRGDGVILQGIEFDAQGRRVAYWLFDEHPGEVVPTRVGSFTSKRVDARHIDHIFDVLRPGQARGAPWLTPAALRMRDVDEYEEAELLRKKIEACFSVFVRRTGTSSPVGEVADSGGTKIERISPGLIHYLDADDEVSFGTPAAVQGIAEYLNVNLHAISAGVGTTYEMLTGDLSKVNYSSIREGKLEFWQSLDHWQWHMLVPMGCDPAWARVHQAYARLGKGPREIPEVEWAMPRRPLVDPDKDGKAMERDLRMGRATWPQMVTEAGRNPDEQLAEIEEWKPRITVAGVTFDSSPSPAPAVADDNNGDGTDDDTEDDDPPRAAANGNAAGFI